MTYAYGPTSKYLTNHPILRTTDLDEARHRIGQKFCDHRLTLQDRAKPLSVMHNHVAGQNISINYLHYGADVTIDPGMLGSFFLLQIPLSGQASVKHRGVEVTASTDTATVLNPDRETRMEWKGNCRKLLLQIDKLYLESVAQSLIGGRLPGPIRFDPAVNLSTQSGGFIKNLVVSCAKAVDQGELFHGQLCLRDLRVENDLALAILSLQRSNISHIIESSDSRASTKSIRCAVDYIYANLSEPISLTDIAQNAGMNVRTLQKGFQRTFGLTPMNFLRNARLDLAHYQLIAKKNPEKVTSVAYATGFSHLGRFSRDYKRRFGYSPSSQL